MIWTQFGPPLPYRDYNALFGVARDDGFANDGPIPA